MNKIIFSIFILLFFLQFSFFPMFSPTGVNINLLLAFAVVLTKQFSFYKIFPWLILMGIICDYFSTQALGVGIITFLLIGFLIDFAQKKISINEKSVIFSIIFYVFIKIVFDIIVIFVEKVFAVLRITEMLEDSLDIMSPSYLWGTLGFVIACLILSKFFDKMKNLNSTNLKLEN